MDMLVAFTDQTWTWAPAEKRFPSCSPQWDLQEGDRWVALRSFENLGPREPPTKIKHAMFVFDGVLFMGVHNRKRVFLAAWDDDSKTWMFDV